MATDALSASDDTEAKRKLEIWREANSGKILASTSLELTLDGSEIHAEIYDEDSNSSLRTDELKCGGRSDLLVCVAA